MSESVSPVLVRVVRGKAVESFHRGRIAMFSERGSELEIGDVATSVFWRSAAKPFQAAAALEGGVVERFGLSDEDVALMCASHNGEDSHAQRALALLERIGAGEDDLKCGPHSSISARVGLELAARGEKPSKARSNCSGKHSGMLLFCEAIGADRATYTDPEHPIQLRIREAVGEICEAEGIEPGVAIDGCSAPTFALPLVNLAIGFRNLSLGGRGKYGNRLAPIRDAMTGHPFLVAGTGRFDTDLMTVTRGRVLSKVGAEGVVACGVRERGLGIAVKIDDGTTRAYEPLLIELLRRLGVLDDDEVARLASHRAATLKNFAGLVTGRTEVTLP